MLARQLSYYNIHKNKSNILLHTIIFIFEKKY